MLNCCMQKQWGLHVARRSSALPMQSGACPYGPSVSVEVESLYESASTDRGRTRFPG